jgi:hypothetical protein
MAGTRSSALTVEPLVDTVAVDVGVLPLDPTASTFSQKLLETIVPLLNSATVLFKPLTVDGFPAKVVAMVKLVTPEGIEGHHHAYSRL